MFDQTFSVMQGTATDIFAGVGVDCIRSRSAPSRGDLQLPTKTLLMKIVFVNNKYKS